MKETNLVMLNDETNQEVVRLLMTVVGETGVNEGVVDVVKRLIADSRMRTLEKREEQLNRANILDELVEDSDEIIDVVVAEEQTVLDVVLNPDAFSDPDSPHDSSENRAEDFSGE